MSSRLCTDYRSMRMYRRLAALLALLSLGASDPAARRVALILKPVTATGEAPSGLRVEETLAPSRDLTLRLDTLAPALDRTRDQLTALEAYDGRGALPLSGPRPDQGHYLVWRATRPTVGEVHISYLMPSALPQPKRRGPHVDLQAINGGVSGAFKGFLLAPEGRLDASIHWALAPGQQAVTSLGDGDVRVTLSADALGEALFVAGSLHEAPKPLPEQGLGIAVLGDNVRLQPASDWIERAYAAECGYFRAPTDKPFRILIRSYAGGPVASGHAVPGTFLYYVPPGTDLDTLDNRQTFAHEFVHSLSNDLSDESGQGGTWYTEGIADYFSLVLPYRAGLYTSAEYRSILDQMVAAYYTNPLRGITNVEVDQSMWTGGVSWRVPYTRGMMYFADLDAKLRARRSPVTVLDLVNMMGERFRVGAPKTNATWAALLQERVGSWAVADWRAMLAGKLIVPPNDAFGPGLVRRTRTAGLFNLGFAKPSGLHAGVAISDVNRAGNAWRAGLRDGDVIAANIDINPLASGYATLLALPIRRAGRAMIIRYDPHQGNVEAYEWSSTDH